MTRTLLTGITALLLETGTAHADCCDMAPITPATREFYVAAIRQFGHRLKVEKNKNAASRAAQ